MLKKITWWLILPLLILSLLFLSNYTNVIKADTVSSGGNSGLMIKKTLRSIPHKSIPSRKIPHKALPIKSTPISYPSIGASTLLVQTPIGNMFVKTSSSTPPEVQVVLDYLYQKQIGGFPIEVFPDWELSDIEEIRTNFFVSRWP